VIGAAQRQVALVGPALGVAAYELRLLGSAIGGRQAQGFEGLAAGGVAEYVNTDCGLAQRKQTVLNP